MKIGILLVIILPLPVLIFILVTAFPIIPNNLREISIRIVDKGNDEPIANILCYYVLETAWLKNIVGIPLSDPVNYRYIGLEAFRSNNDGEITIKNKIIFLKLYERIFRERIYINLGNQKKKKVEGNEVKSFIVNFDSDNLSFINPHYKGFIIYSGIDKVNTQVPLNKTDYYSLLVLNGNNLQSCKTQNVIIRLEETM